MNLKTLSYTVFPFILFSSRHNTGRIKKYSRQLGSLASSTLAYVLLATLVNNSAYGQVVNNLTVGNPKALALANAVTADPVGVDSIHFNPAGLAKIKGRQANVNIMMPYLTLEDEVGTRCDQNGTCPNTTSGQGFLSAIESHNNNDWPTGTYPDDPLQNTSGSTSSPYQVLPGPSTIAPGFMPIPSAGIAYEDPDTGFVFGTAFYAPEALGYKRDASDPGSYQAEKLSIARVTYFSPSVGFRFNEQLSIGVSVGFSWQGFAMTNQLRTPLTTLALISGTADGALNTICDNLSDAACNSDISGNDPDNPLNFIRDIADFDNYDEIGQLQMEMEDYLSLSFNLGLLWEPTEWLALGFTYRSAGPAALSGTYKFDYSPAFTSMVDGLTFKNDTVKEALALLGIPLQGNSVQEGDVTLEYKMPQSLSFGSSIKVFSPLKFNVDLKWVDYSQWDDLTFKFSDPTDYTVVASIVDPRDARPDELILERGYDSKWSGSMGLEYALTRQLLLRGGYEYRASPAPEDKLDFMIPIAAAHLYTVGAGWKFDQYSHVDAGFGYMVSKWSIGPCESSNANSCNISNAIYNPYPGEPLSSKTTLYMLAVGYGTKF